MAAGCCSEANKQTDICCSTSAPFLWACTSNNPTRVTRSPEPDSSCLGWKRIEHPSLVKVASLSQGHKGATDTGIYSRFCQFEWWGSQSTQTEGERERKREKPYRRFWLQGGGLTSLESVLHDNREMKRMDLAPLTRLSSELFQYFLWILMPVVLKCAAFCST